MCHVAEIGQRVVGGERTYGVVLGVIHSVVAHGAKGNLRTTIGAVGSVSVDLPLSS